MALLKLTESWDLTKISENCHGFQHENQYYFRSVSCDIAYVCILCIHACMYNICTLYIYIYHSSLSALISSSNHFQSTHQTPNSVDPDRHVPKLFQQDQGCRPIIGVPTCRSQSDVVTFVTRPKGGRRKREARGLHPGWTPYEFHGIFLVVIFWGGDPYHGLL